MTAPAIHQWLPAAHWGDATGDAAMHLATALRSAGYRAEVYALTIDPPLAGTVHPFEAMPRPAAGDLTVLHFALPSVLTPALIQAPGRKAIVYHNLTPPHLLAPFCPDVARLTATGREQLAQLSEHRDLDAAIGVSRFNTADLDATGFPNTTTLPLPLDLKRYDETPDRLLTAQMKGRPRLFLTVGRVAPNKRIEHLFRAAAYYLRYIDPEARFAVVGGNRGLEAYTDALVRLHEELGLDDRVRLVGRVSHAELIAWYRHADAYVCTSEHEGFCAPLLEAMHFGVPILARACAAVPETLGNAGITVNEDDPARIAELLHLLATDADLRARLRQRGQARLADFAPSAVVSRWVATLGGIAGRTP